MVQRAGFSGRVRGSKGIHHQPGQDQALARKRERQAANAQALVDEAARQGISVEELKKLKASECDAIRAKGPQMPTYRSRVGGADESVTRAGSKGDGRGYSDREESPFRDYWR